MAGIKDKNKTPGQLGHGFEDRVRRAFERNGYALVKKNYWKRNYDFANDSAPKREYDLVMFNTAEKQFYIIECKAHYSEQKYVGVKLVQDFTRKLENYNGMSAVRVMVSDTDFTKTARKYSEKNNIELINSEDLMILERNNSGFIKSRITGLAFSGLESLINTVINNYKRRDA
jgi:hypothetical protein